MTVTCHLESVNMQTVIEYNELHLSNAVPSTKMLSLWVLNM